MDVQMRVGQLADHDGCGAKECAKPDHTTGVDAEIEWFARTLFAPAADSPNTQEGESDNSENTRKDDDV